MPILRPEIRTVCAVKPGSARMLARRAGCPMDASDPEGDQEIAQDTALSLTAQSRYFPEMPPSPPGIAFLGNRALWSRPKLAFFCSAKCPGAILLRVLKWVPTLAGRNDVVLASAEERNRWLAEHAEQILVAWATPGGRLESSLRDIPSAKKLPLV